MKLPRRANGRPGALYRDLWQTAIDVNADWVLITSFNEWHEGSEIEPSQEYGEQYLGLTAELARLSNKDTTPPEITFTTLAEGAVLSGTLQVMAQASDSGDINLVRYLLDGRAQATTTASPYTFTWNTTQTADGPHTLTAQAFDRAGNTASRAITVRVKQP